MDKITFAEIDKLAEQSKRPLSNRLLEDFQREHFGKFCQRYYRFFYYLVAEMRPRIALEIGIDHGHTIVHMATGSRETMVIGLDNREWCADLGIAAFAPKNCLPIYENSLKAKEKVEEIVCKYGRIGIVFQDSSHYYDESRQEYDIYSKFLDDNAIWCCDDILPVFYDPKKHPKKTMTEYFDSLPGEKKLYDDLHYGSVIGITLL